MSAELELKDILEALDMVSDEESSFLELETGQVITVSTDLLGQAEACPDDEDPDILDWQEDEFKDARRIVDNPSAFLRLPTKFDIHDWSIMERFTHTVKSDRVRAELLRALHGKGAFRYFRDVVSRNDLFEDWQAYRAEALKDIAISWCEENHVIWK